jgi:hypothetical protein
MKILVKEYVRPDGRIVDREAAILDRYATIWERLKANNIVATMERIPSYRRISITLSDMEHDLAIRVYRDVEDDERMALVGGAINMMLAGLIQLGIERMEKIERK